jgi:hypothetical protein
MPCATIDRLIAWAEGRRLAIDIHFAKGTVKIDRHRFASPDAALAWATRFSQDWGFTAP